MSIWGDVPNRRMDSFPVVEALDVLKNCTFSCITSFKVVQIDQFLL